MGLEKFLVLIIIFFEIMGVLLYEFSSDCLVIKNCYSFLIYRLNLKTAYCSYLDGDWTLDLLENMELYEVGGNNALFDFPVFYIRGIYFFIYPNIIRFFHHLYFSEPSKEEHLNLCWFSKYFFNYNLSKYIQLGPLFFVIGLNKDFWNVSV